MNKFVRSLLAELIPVWMTPQEPRRDEPPTAGREPNPGSRPGEEPILEPEVIPPIDPDEQERPIVPPIR